MISGKQKSKQTLNVQCSCKKYSKFFGKPITHGPQKRMAGLYRHAAFSIGIWSADQCSKRQCLTVCKQMMNFDINMVKKNSLIKKLLKHPALLTLVKKNRAKARIRHYSLPWAFLFLDDMTDGHSVLFISMHVWNSKQLQVPLIFKNWVRNCEILVVKIKCPIHAILQRFICQYN